MKTLLLWLLICGTFFAHDYHPVDKWLKPPKGLEHIGDGHGEIAVDSTGLIYVSVTSGAKAGVQIYDEKGAYLRNLPNAPNDLHGFVIHREEGGEFLYGATMNAGTVVKMDLDGKVLMTIPSSKIPDQYKKKKKGKLNLKLTSADVAPNGDIYVVDGYGSDYIHRFRKNGDYLSTFGGRAAPYNFVNCHKVFIDNRYNPPRLLCTNRAKRTLVHLSLEGEFIGIHAKNLRRPSSISFREDDIAVAEIEGRVSILNKKGEIVSVVSFNEAKYNGNRWKPEQWQSGLVGSPHGIAFDRKGNLLMTEYNKYGRVMRFDLKKNSIVE